jgi:hypothetical protein
MKKNFKRIYNLISNIMKKVHFLILTVVMLFVAKSNAQLSVNISLGNQPHQHNDYYYDDNVDYYFLPEIQAYFDNRTGVYVYFNAGSWVRSRYLPDYCRNYDINRGERIPISYKGNSPHDYFYSHKKRYCYNESRRDYDNERDNNDRRENQRYACEGRKHHKNKHFREYEED